MLAFDILFKPTNEHLSQIPFASRVKNGVIMPNSKIQNGNKTVISFNWLIVDSVEIAGALP